METSTRIYRDNEELEEGTRELTAEGWALQTVTALVEGGVRAEYVRPAPEIPLGPPEDDQTHA